MAEILITGMEMPKYCRHCRFESSSIHGQYCILTKKFTRLDDNEDGSERHISCSLVEVPPHGRLGDLDKLQKKVEDCAFVPEQSKTMYMMAVEKEIKKAPTIIEASKERKK